MSRAAACRSVLERVGIAKLLYDNVKQIGDLSKFGSGWAKEFSMIGAKKYNGPVRSETSLGEV